MLTLLRLEIRRMLADKRFLILMLCLPIFMYLLFTNLFGAGQRAYGLDQNISLMVSMAAYGAIGAAFMATAPRIAAERTNGWLRQLKVMPIPAHRVIMAKVLCAMVWAIPAIALVDLAAVIDHGVRLAAWQWLGIGGLLWVGTAPFAALGAFLGYLADESAAFGVMYGIYIFLGAVGGLWMPVDVLPTALRHVAVVLPSNRFAELGWNLAAAHGPSGPGVAILTGWLAAFAALAVAAYRRANAAR
ncbi:ABC transporter permease [Amycolatopsis taiwanensis]|uniref:ABC transporter permease n=1 Tax=Amycolatopsis taiwanensis TaxID=342230 RepID=UPI000489F411|nr:ABC transporter permease [Amycolatopsis taiwanensis]